MINENSEPTLAEDSSLDASVADTHAPPVGELSEPVSVEDGAELDKNAEKTENEADPAQPIESTAEAPPDESLENPPEIESGDVAAEDGSSAEVASDEVASDEVASDEVASDEVAVGGAPPAGGEDELEKQWYILKVQVNRENSIRDALNRRIKIEGLEEYFGEILVPTEDVAEFDKNGKKRITKKKLYPGYIVAHMAVNDDTWFLVRETPGIGDFTGAAGKPSPMSPQEVQRILASTLPGEATEEAVKTAIPFKVDDKVRVKEGYFQNFEGVVESIDEANGRVTVMINIFGRSTPVELEHWQIEDV